MNRKRRISLAQLICACIVMVCIVVAVWAYLGSMRKIDYIWSSMEYFISSIGPFDEEMKVVQHFTAPADNMKELDLMIAVGRSKKLGKGMLTFTLRGPDGNIVATKTLTNEEIENNQMVSIAFDPQPNSGSTLYTLEATAAGFVEGSAPHLRAGTIDSGEVGLSLMVNDEVKQETALYMQIVYYNNEYRWEFSFLVILLALIAGTTYPLLPSHKEKEKK